MRRWLRRAALAFVLLSAGCPHDPDAATIEKIVAALGISEAIATQRGGAGRAFKHFVRRRARYLVGQNSEWANEPNYPRLTQRLRSEMDAIIALLDGKLGTPAAPGPLGGARDPDATPHVDLADVAKVYVDDTDAVIASRQDQFVQARRKRIDAIVWRSCALHHELWDGSDSATSASLNLVAANDILDRRLRAAERMLYIDDAIADRAVTWTLEGVQSWKDQTRVITLTSGTRSPAPTSLRRSSTR
jgi:hypothetical protein